VPLFLRHVWQNVPNLEKCATLEKNAPHLKKMCHSWKHAPHAEKFATLRNMRHTCKKYAAHLKKMR